MLQRDVMFDGAWKAFIQRLRANLNNDSLVVILHVPNSILLVFFSTFSIPELLFRYGSSDSPRGHYFEHIHSRRPPTFSNKIYCIGISFFFLSLCAYFCMWIAHKKPPTEKSNMEKVQLLWIHFRSEDFLLFSLSDLLFVRSRNL